MKMTGTVKRIQTTHGDKDEVKASIDLTIVSDKGVYQPAQMTIKADSEPELADILGTSVVPGFTELKATDLVFKGHDSLETYDQDKESS